MCGIELGNPILPCQCGVAQREHWIRTLSDDHLRRPFNQLKRFECHEQDLELRRAYMLGIDLLEHILVRCCLGPVFRVPPPLRPQKRGY